MIKSGKHSKEPIQSDACFFYFTSDSDYNTWTLFSLSLNPKIQHVCIYKRLKFPVTFTEPAFQ